MAKHYKDMCWNVYVNDMNRRITVFNIFRHISFYRSVVDDLKKSNTKEEFSEPLRRSLFYYFGSKCEWEVVITDWPSHIKTTELDRLNEEREEKKEFYGRDPYSLCVNLEPEKKVDVYWQIYNNWDIFLDYVWSHKQPKRKKKVS